MKLRELREQKGVTQKEVAIAVGCTSNVYSRYERGEREPDITTLCSLADYFRVSIDSIIGYSCKQKKRTVKIASEKSLDFSEAILRSANY